MDVVSTCPLRVGYVVWRPRPDAWTLTVVCKATYLLLPDESPLAPEQDEPVEADSHWDDDGTRSLHAATDMVPFKKRAEVLLVGHAHAPFGQPVSALRTRLVVGDVDKAIEVVADRAWTMDGQLVEGAPFTKMPLRWERAGGGPGTGNPVGVRADARPDSRGWVMLPNLQPPGAVPTHPGEPIAPVGYGPLAPTWPERLARRQQVAVGWDHRAWAQQPLPESLDPAFFNAAPSDQQINVLRASERIVLENLHPKHARLSTHLAGVSPVAEVVSTDPSSKRSALRCDTLVIDTDRGACTLTWRAQIPIADPNDPVRVVISFAQPARRPGAVVPADRPSTPAAAPPVVKKGGTVDMEAKDAMPPVPFQIGRSPLAGTTLGGLPRTPPAPQVSFAELEDDTTAEGFGAGRSGYPTPAIGVQLPDVIDDPTTQTQVLPPPAGWATWTMREVSLPSSPLEPPPAAASEASPAPRSGPPIERFPIERCAKMVASIGRRRRDEQSILEENDVGAAEFRAVERHWVAALTAEAQRGQRALLDRYDDAYVAQLEAERGPIGPMEYARLAVAAERGTAATMLAALSLPRDATMRIERVWLRRMLADMVLSKQVRSAISAAREE